MLPSRYTGTFDNHVFGERLQRGQDELWVDPTAAVIVGGGDLVGALEATDGPVKCGEGRLFGRP